MQKEASQTLDSLTKTTSFTSLLRSAKKKSSESLKSLRRKGEANRAAEEPDTPPVPALPTFASGSEHLREKPLPPIDPSSNVRASAEPVPAPTTPTTSVSAASPYFTPTPTSTPQGSGAKGSPLRNQGSVSELRAARSRAASNSTGTTTPARTAKSPGQMDHISPLRSGPSSSSLARSFKNSGQMSPSPSPSPSRPPSRVRRLSNKLSFSSHSRGGEGGADRSGAATPTQKSVRQGISNTTYMSSRHPQSPTHSGNSASKEGDGNTIAQLYAVFGLPKDPSVWTLAEDDCVAGAHHVEGAVGRFWRPEVLGCSICPPPSEVLAEAGGRDGPSRSASRASRKKDTSKWEGGPDGKKTNPKFIEMADGRGGVERAETARVLSKALKLSFTREIEVTTGPGNYPPPSSSHTFSFSVPTIRSSLPTLNNGPDGQATADARKAAGAMGVATSAIGEGYGLDASISRRVGASGSGTASAEDTAGLATFYGVVLIVWSAADERRAKAVKRELNRVARARAGKASISKSASKRSAWTADGTDATADDDDEPEGLNGGAFSFLPENNTFFMPYAICIVSRYPIYNLLGDWNKAAWHKYSRNIEMHNKLMAAILRQPAPRLGETVRIDSPDEDVTFVCTFPGAVDWGRGLIGIDFTMWPLFKTLSLDNILTICEIALSPSGRVLFLSRHPALMGLAVETIRYLVELCGWKGVAHQNCHARDVRIYLEDPGSWLIAINNELRSIVKPAKEVCVVDLDINFVNCPRPPLKAPSTKGLRDKKRRKLIHALGFSSADYGPPREFIEAFPSARFRPLSVIESRTDPALYDRLEPPSWWDQGAVIAAFDQVLHEGSKQTFLKKVLRMKAAKQPAASQAELAAIMALRRRASTFVDARDGLENKIGRLNKRLAFLMSEGEMWKLQFEKIQQLVDRLTSEANSLRGKVDKERRESKRLSSTLAQRDMEQVQLQLQLRETEQARENAQLELEKMRAAMDNLEHEREAMMDEIRNIISTSGDSDFDLSKLDMMADLGSRRSSRSGSPASAMTHNTELSILRSRALAEQRISMGRPRAASSSLRKSSTANASQEQGEMPARDRRVSHQSSAQNHFPDDQMNYEIQQRTSSVTDQISRIQQQLESTLTHLEGRRSGTFERERERRRMSVSSVNSFRYEHGPPSSLGHYNNATPSVGHATELAQEKSNGYEAVENMQDSKPDNDGRSPNLNRRHDRAPPSSFRAPGTSASNARQTTPGRNGQTGAAPTLSPKHPGRPQSTASPSTADGHTFATPSGDSPGLTSPRASSAEGHFGIQFPRSPELSSSSAHAVSHGVPTSRAAVATTVAIAAGSATAAAISASEDGKPIQDTPVPATDENSPATPSIAEVTQKANETTLDGAAPDDASDEGTDEDDGADFNMFEEPEDFRPKTPPSTVTYYDFPGTDEKVALHLVGNHPLWGHLAWNASYCISDYICANAPVLTLGKRVLELGAAAGLPSIVCNWTGASQVVATDYPDPDLVGNLTKNLMFNCGKDAAGYKGPGDVAVEGFIWGSDPSKVLSHLEGKGEDKKFDVIILSDLVFNHQAHPALLETCDACLADAIPADVPLEEGQDESLVRRGQGMTPCVLVFFTHHRPHLAYKDMGFFDMAEVKGWKFEKLGEWLMKPMFPDDPGDEKVRSTIHGYRLWRA